MADVSASTTGASKYAGWVFPCKGGVFRSYATPVLGVKVNVVLCSKCKLPHSAHKKGQR